MWPSSSKQHPKNDYLRYRASLDQTPESCGTNMVRSYLTGWRNDGITASAKIKPTWRVVDPVIISRLNCESASLAKWQWWTVYFTNLKYLLPSSKTKLRLVLIFFLYIDLYCIYCNGSERRIWCRSNGACIEARSWEYLTWIIGRVLSLCLNAASFGTNLRTVVG